MIDETNATATDEFGESSAALGVLQAQAQAFSDVGRTLTEAVEKALKQASEITGQAQEHAIGVVSRAERRVAESLRQATVAERRATMAQARLIELEARIDQAQAKLAEIGTRANEIARLSTTVEVLPTSDERIPYRWDQQNSSVPGSSEHQEAPHGADLDPLSALASLRDTVDAAS
ncbi:MAG TPA: hypothetical protein VKV73_31275 [Chloroflexota bacterium]|nr:hypothetical protein [Chloroflexota bacterium]